MYGAEVIISRISPTYYIKIYAWAVLLTACTLKSLYDFAVYGYDRAWPLVLILAAAGIIGRIFLVGKIKQITVTASHMIIDYTGKKPQDVIDYTQIVSNRSLGYSNNGQGYKKQLIDLDDGRQLIYTNMKFENYNDLKNNIYRYMVAANQHGTGVSYQI